MDLQQEATIFWLFQPSKLREDNVLLDMVDFSLLVWMGSVEICQLQKMRWG